MVDRRSYCVCLSCYPRWPRRGRVCGKRSARSHYRHGNGRNGTKSRLPSAYPEAGDHVQSGRLSRNDPDGTVVRLQGDKDRIDKTLEAISAGTKTSSKANIIGEIQTALDPDLKTFTIFGWTSQKVVRSRTPMTWSLICDRLTIRSPRKRQRSSGTRLLRAP